MKKYILSALFTMMLLVTATITQAQSECSVTLSQPEQLTAVVSGDAEICYGGTATITVTMNGGTAPYKVFYDGNTYLAGGDPHVITFDVTLTEDAVFTGLGSTPNISATDARNCLPVFSGSATITIEDEVPVITECPIARYVEGCDIYAVTDPVFSALETETTYEIFSNVTNQGIATDNCSEISVFYQDEQTGSCPTIITRTWTIRDAAGNEASCEQTITLDDTTYPTFTAPADLTVYTNSECEYDISIAITGDVTDEWDNCSTGLQATFTDSEPVAGDCPGSFTVIRTWSLTDGCLNKTEHNQTITIVDNTAPTWITAVGALNADLECGDEEALAAALALIPEATDECSNVTIEEIDPEVVIEDCIGTTGGNINAGNGSYFRFTLSGFDGLTANQIENINLQFQTNQGKGRAEFTLVSPSGQGIILVGPYCIGGNCEDTDGDWEIYAPTFYPNASGYTKWDNENIISEGAGNFIPNGALTSSNSGIISGLTGYVSKIEDLTGPMNGEWFVYARKQQNVNGSIKLDYACVAPIFHDECENNDVITRAWVAKDACGNVSDPYTQIIQVKDTQGPVISAPANLDIVCEDATNLDVVVGNWLAEATANDECQGSVEVYNDFDPESLSLACGETVTVTFTAVDACENAATPVTRTITVIDITAPVITAPENLEIVCDGDVDPETEIALWLAQATASDECDATVTVQNDYDGQISMACGDQITVTFTAVDACENAATPVTRTITVIDITAPVITAPENLEIVCDGDVDPETEIALWLAQATASDECDATVTVQNDYDGQISMACGDQITVIFTAVDACENAATPVTRTITVIDITAPVITAPENLDIVCANGYDPTVEINNWLAEAIASDDCDLNVQVLNDFAGIEMVCGEEVVVTFTAVDACENAATPVTATIKIVDTTPPTWVTLPGALNADLECGDAEGLNEALALIPEAIDECSDVIVEEITPDRNIEDCLGTPGGYVSLFGSYYRFTLSGFDDKSASEIEKIAMQFTTNLGKGKAEFTLVSPSGQGIILVGPYCSTGDCNDNNFLDWEVYQPTFYPASSGYAQWNNSNSIPEGTGNFTPSGATTSSNESLILGLNEYVTRIEDLTGPMNGNWFVYSRNTEIELGLIYLDYVCLTPEKSDDCENDQLITRSWVAKDACGNESDPYTQIINITDTEGPIITAPENLDIVCDQTTNLEEVIGSWLDEATANDVCQGDVPVNNDFNLDSFDLACGETVTVTFTSVDACENEATPVTRTITVIDITAPVITAPQPLTLTCDQSVDYATQISTWLASATVADACDQEIEITNDYDGYTQSCGTVITVTFNAMDDCENTAEPVTSTITFIDETAPVITAPENLEIVCNSDVDPETEIAEWLAEATATDECDALVTVQNDYEGQIDMTCGDQITVTFTAVDACENAATPVTRTITVIDITAPVITAPENLEIVCNSDVDPETEIAEWLAEATATDECDALVTVQNDYEGQIDMTCGDQITVTFTAVDACENAATPVTRTITVIDITAPVITAPQPLTLTCDQSVDYASQISEWLGSATVADECDQEIEITNDYDGYTQSCGTVITVTFNAMDDCENTAEPVTSTITFIDETAPVITAPQPLYIACDDQNAQYTIAQWLAAAVATDECDTYVEVSNNFVSIDGYNCNNPLIITFNAYDDCQNAAEPVTSTIYIVDDEAPVITTAQGALDMTIECSDEQSLGYALSLAPEATDNCSVPGILMISDITTPDAECENGYTRVRTWRFVDECSNYSADYTQTITVQDNIAPTWTIIPSAMQVECDGEGNLEDINYWLNLFTGTDNCGEATVTNNFEGLSDLCGMTGSAQVTFTLSDACGNSISETATFTIVDTQDPVFTEVPENITVSCTEVPEPATPVAIDNCSNVEVVYNGQEIETGDCAGSYTIFRNWTAYDECGNSVGYTQTITVEDNTAPEFTIVPEDMIVECDGEGNITDLNTWLNIAEATDNCGEVIITNNFNGLTNECGNTGSATVIFTATDDCGNSSTYTASFMIIDTSVPTLTVPANVVVDNDEGVCGAQVDLIATADDDCGLVTITNNITGTNDASGFYEVGTTTILWTATDECGNTVSGQTIVTVNDTEAPSITCPQDITIGADPESCDAFVNVPWPEFSDNCNVNSIVNSYTGTANASTTYPIGTTEITWTVTDEYGNTAECTMTVTVEDDIDPVITCPEDVIVTNDPGLCGAEVSIPQPEASDNCGIATIINDFNGTGNASGFYPVGTTVITWTVTDNYGNTAECTMTVTVNDNENPVITCPEDITVSTDSDICGAMVTIPAPVATDNCGIETIVNDFTGTSNASGEYPVGTTTIIWTVTDIHGNTATCEMTVTVNDGVNPTIECPEDITANTDPGACSAMIEIPVPEVADNCGIESITNDFNGTANASGEYPVGTTTIIWTVTDIHGNTAECEMTVTVTDAEAPAITCPEDIAGVVVTENCEAYVEIPEPEVSDNCGIESVINDFNSTGNASGYYPAGTTTITWTVTDIHGNTSTCSMTVTVIAPPVALDDFATTELDTPVTIDVLANDTDCDNNIDPTTLINVTNPENGSVMVDNGKFIYTPNSGYFGTDTFNYTICDAQGSCDEATVIITIEEGEPPVEIRLIAVDDNSMTEFNTPRIINNLENDTYNFEGVIPAVSILEAPLHGTVSVNSDNTVTYNPYADYSGNDIYTYILSDLNGIAISDTAVSTIVIAPAPPRDTLIIYNVITPDGDNYNDFWYLEGISEYPDNEVLIFNRWGDQIRYFENYDNKDVRWDGSNKSGDMLPAATYYYIIKLRSVEKIYTGWVVVHSHDKK